MTKGVNPDMAFTDYAFRAFPNERYVANTTGITYRDSATYLEILEDIRHWVNEDLPRDLNKALNDIREENDKTLTDFDKRISGRIQEFGAVPELVRQATEKAYQELKYSFDIFVDKVNDIVRRKLAEQEVDTFNYLKGEVTPLAEVIRDQHQHYTIHGFRATDFARAGFTAKDIDNFPFDILFMETEGKYFIPWLSRHYCFSPVTGNWVDTSRAIAEVYGRVIKNLSSSANPFVGIPGISSTPPYSIAGATVQDLHNRGVEAHSWTFFTTDK